MPSIALQNALGAKLASLKNLVLPRDEMTGRQHEQPGADIIVRLLRLIKRMKVEKTYLTKGETAVADRSGRSAASTIAAPSAFARQS